MDLRLTAAFCSLTGHERLLSWQEDLLSQLVEARIPTAVDLPTGLGKTSVMALWLVALAAQMDDGGEVGLPRRLVYVVDRRVVVDQATDEARRIRESLQASPELSWMRVALGLEADGDVRPLPVTALRGRLADNKEWLADPTSPAIIVGTVDMVGSRLLFSGYGVTRRMRPYHAGLLGVDTLVLLDEAHLVPPFERLLAVLSGRETAAPWHTGELWPETRMVRPLRLLPLSATHRGATPTGSRQDVFSLRPEHVEADEVVRRRVRAVKRLELKPFPASGKEKDDDAALEAALVGAVGEILGGDGGERDLALRRLVVYCDRRKVAEDVHKALEDAYTPKEGRKRLPCRIELELFTGARRILEREQAARRLRELGFLGEPGPLERPVVLVATSAAEVGIDLDADDLVCDLVPLERMIQRFGRVNRAGKREDTRVVVVHPEPVPEKQNRAAQLASTLEMLRQLAEQASPEALRRVVRNQPELVARAMTPPPLHPPLTLAVVESWSLTNLREHAGRPDVAPWLRGWEERAVPQAEVLWRTHLPCVASGKLRREDIHRFFATARPHLLEVVETSASDIAATLVARAKDLKQRADKDDAADSLLDAEVFVLTRANEFVASIPVRDLADKTKKKEISDLAEKIAHHRVVVPAALGGLGDTGLLGKEAKNAALALDDPGAWPPKDPRIDDAGALAKQIGFRVRRAKIEPREGDRLQEAVVRGPSDEGWVVGYALPLEPTADADEPRDALIVELWRGAGEAPMEGDPAITRRAQQLSEHLDWVAAEADRIANRLNLPGDMRTVLRAAGGLHDLGKRRPIWQIAMHGSVDRPLAKTTAAGNGRLLGGYRHEFGSVLDVRHGLGGVQLHARVIDEYRGLSDDARALVLHLVAAHHGWAHPSMPAVDPTLPPSALDREVQDIALRFARLQRRYGPWGLAWIEALLRAADQRASARLDASEPSAGSEKRGSSRG